MAKAPSLRKDWTKGTQRTRKLSTGNALWRLREWEGTLRGASGSRRKIAGVKPGAVKACAPVLNGGDEETGLCRPRLVATQLECGLRPERATPGRLLALVRGQWQIENQSHWVRDVTFDED